ncbi:MAG: hypothetical protein DK306_001754 [Chloroflexi bacterium]|nr:MAG: hypothetical protein DK306_001754 [Chloroflexota bacterium]
MLVDVRGRARVVLTAVLTVVLMGLLALGLMIGAGFAAGPVLADSHLEPPAEEPDADGPQPTSFADVHTSADFLAALANGGYGPLALQEIGVLTPWIPVVSDGILVLEGASIEVYSMTAAQAEEALGNISGEGGAFHPPANATIWRGLEFILILRDAPNQAAVEALITSIVGPPALATIATGPLPLPPPAGGGDDGTDAPRAEPDPPMALPASGSGGLADVDLAGAGSNDVPLWVIVMASALAAAGVAGVVRLETTRSRG